MSYILEALKKSEQERGRKSSPVPARQEAPRRDLPDGKIVRESGLDANGSAGSQKGVRITILLVSLLFASGVLIYFVIGERAAEKTTESSEAITGGSLETHSATQANSSSGQGYFDRKNDSAKSLTVSEISVPTVVAASEGAAEETFATGTENTDETLAKSRAPFAALERIPDLEITGHTYSSVPGKRTVVMNDKVWREGDILVEDVLLKEITRDGILLDVAGWPVVIGRSRGWKAVN